MGMSMGISRSSYDGPPVRPSPDPLKYKFLQWEQVGEHCVVLVQYEGCTNYEGMKIMVYKAWMEELRNQPPLDPHFSENKQYHSPIARFEPTVTGWKNAITFCKAII